MIPDNYYETLDKLKAENAKLQERLKRRETLLAEIRDKFILHFRLLTEVSGNKEEQEFISRWRDRIDDAGCYAASPLVEDGDKLYVGREVWAVDRPDAKEGGAEPLPAMFLPEDETPVFRVDCQRLISAGCTEDAHAELRERAEKAEEELRLLSADYATAQNLIAVQRLAVDEMRERALAAETRNIGLIHAADTAKKGEASYRKMYEERREKHLEAVARAEKAEADCAVLWKSLKECVTFADYAYDYLPDNVAANWPVLGNRASATLGDITAGARLLAVVRAAADYCDNYRDDAYMGGNSPFDIMCDEVDAYRQQEGQENGYRETE